MGTQAAVRDRVGLLCDQLSRWPTLHATIDSAGADNELGALLALLAGPHEPDLGKIETLLDAIDQACARIGLAALTSRAKGPAPWAGLPPGLAGHPGPAGWTCPLRRCDRVVTPDETSAPPTCAAAQVLMSAYNPPSR